MLQTHLFRGYSISALLIGGLLLGPVKGTSQTPEPARQAAQPEATLPWISLTPKQLNRDSTLQTQLTAAVRAARREGRIPVVEIGAPWCGPCQYLEAFMKGPEMASAIQHLYVISLDDDLWKKDLLHLGFDAATGIPRMVAIDSTGHPVGEPWRPRDIPDSLKQKLGQDGAMRTTLQALFAKAQQQFSNH